MSTAEIANIFGFIAAGIGIIMYIPQTLKLWKTKNTKSISLSSFLLIALASVCWTVYGVILNATPVIIVNVFVLIITSFIVLMKIRYG